MCAGTARIAGWQHSMRGRLPCEVAKAAQGAAWGCEGPRLPRHLAMALLCMLDGTSQLGPKLETDLQGQVPIDSPPLFLICCHMPCACQLLPRQSVIPLLPIHVHILCAGGAAAADGGGVAHRAVGEGGAGAAGGGGRAAGADGNLQHHTLRCVCVCVWVWGWGRGGRRGRLYCRYHVTVSV